MELAGQALWLVLVPSFSAVVLVWASLKLVSLMPLSSPSRRTDVFRSVMLWWTEIKKRNNLTLMLFPSVLVQVLHINITWPSIRCQNPFTCQIPTPEKSTKQSLSLKQRIWPKTQMWWQEQEISAFHLTRVTVEMAERHRRPLSTVQEVRKEHIWST